MQLVEQHVIDRHDPRYALIVEAAFKSKNLYNAALYEIRQSFIHGGRYLTYNEVQRRMQSHETYKALPAKVGQQILTVLDRNWRSFFEARTAYNEDPSKFQAQVDPSFCVATDLGVTNLAAITSNRVGFIPRWVNGRTLKARNQWYNKRMKGLKLYLPKEDRKRVTKQMEQITNKRNRQMNHYLHAASKGLIDFLVTEGVGTIIIGKNPLWKQGVGIHVEVQEESYTSKASFLDLDPLRLRVAGVGRPGQIAFILFWRIASITLPGASSGWRLSQALID